MQRPPGTRPPSAGFLTGTFVAVAVSFVAVALYTHVTTHQIDVQSDSIAHDSMPSVEHLAAVRVEARQVESLIAEYLGLSGDPAPARDEIDRSIAALDRELNAYLALPLFPGEQPFWDEVRGSLLDAMNSARQVMALADARALDAARALYRTRLRPTLARGSDAAMRDIEFNARTGRYAAVQIREIRRHALWVGLGLDALCLALAFLAATIVRRQIGRHSALLEEHTRLVEARAGELEFFAGRVAHDVASPVSTAQMAVDLALRGRSQDPLLSDVLARAQRNLRRARAIIDGLLRFARAGAKPHPGATADVPQIVADVVKGVAENDTSGADFRWEASPCTAACDPGVLTSILSNLVQNAAKYLGDGPVRRITVRAGPREAAVRVEVEDTGAGLPPDLVGRVFEPYVRGAGHASPGLGLGLATVKRLVDGHGGRVGVDSDPGHGCRFWFELPAASPPSRDASMSIVRA